MVGVRSATRTFLLSLAALGCVDAGAVTAPSAPSEDPGRTLTGSDPSMPWPVSITTATVTIWVETGAIDSYMRYQAYHARIAGSATVTDDDGSAQYLFAPQEKHTFLSYDNHFSRRDHVTVRNTCGTHIVASMGFEAWWQFMSNGGQFAVDSESKGVGAQASQARCAVEEVLEDELAGGSSGGGGIDKPTDNTSQRVCVVRYKYDLNTGEIISRSVLYCY